MSQDFCHRPLKLVMCPTHSRNFMTSTLTFLDKTKLQFHSLQGVKFNNNKTLFQKEKKTMKNYLELYW